MYYVLRCRENGDLSVHYVDLNKIEKRDEHLESFISYSKKFEDKDCIIVDHLTLDNAHYLTKIKRIVEQQVEDPKFILIETGFTATVHRFIEFGRKFQLDEDSFLDIWKGSLEFLISKKDKEDKSYRQKLGLFDKGKEVYDEFSKVYTITPKLLNIVLEDMYTRTDGTVQEAIAQYTKEKQHEIINCKSCENDEYARFQFHTAVLIHFIPRDKEIIIKGKWAQEIKIGINIFEIQHYKIQMEDLEDSPEYARMDVDVGDFCVKIRHLIPTLENCWQERFPCDLEEVLNIAKNVGPDKVLQIMFQNGGARREFQNLFVGAQKKCKCVLLPFPSRGDTLYQQSHTEQQVLQKSWIAASTPAENFFECDGKDLHLYDQDLPANLKGHERDIALFSLFIKQLSKSLDRFLVYPKMPHSMGVDYFVFYGNCGIKQEEECSSSKRVKVQERTLYLVQLATGAMQRGDTIGPALNIVKQFFVNESVAVHAVVMVISRNKKSFTLTRCAFENISVLNFDGTEELLLQKNSLLYQFYFELIKSPES
jgi:hypothetical protein